MENKALWLDGPGSKPRVSAAPMPEPRQGELLVRVKAVAVQPGEWKVQAGLIPIALTYPTVIGVSLSGVVEKVGPGVTRFVRGDHVASNSSGVLRDDHRFGAYQRFALVPQKFTAKIGDTPFDVAASLATAYSAMSALFIHLGLERPPDGGPALPKGEKVLIWGISSSLGAVASQIAQQAGYEVVGVAAGRHAALTKTLGLSQFIDRTSSTVVQDLATLGPFKAVLAANDSAEDQVKIGQALALCGGGRFLIASGRIKPEMQLPVGVSAYFQQFLNDYFDPKNKDFVEWVWWGYFEAVFSDGRLKSVPLEVIGGLSQITKAWDLLRQGHVSWKRLIITPDLD